MYCSENGQVYSVPLAERPLIHLILIQENMQIDTIEAVSWTMIAYLIVLFLIFS